MNRRRLRCEIGGSGTCVACGRDGGMEGVAIIEGESADGESPDGESVRNGAAGFAGFGAASERSASPGEGISNASDSSNRSMPFHSTSAPPPPFSCGRLAARKGCRHVPSMCNGCPVQLHRVTHLLRRKSRSFVSAWPIHLRQMSRPLVPAWPTRLRRVLCSVVNQILALGAMPTLASACEGGRRHGRGWHGRL